MNYIIGIPWILTGIFTLYWFVLRKRKFIVCTCSKASKLIKTKANIPVEVKGKITGKKSVAMLPEPTQIITSLDWYALKDSTGYVRIQKVSGWRNWLQKGDLVRVRGLTMGDSIQPLEIENLTTGKKQTKFNWLIICLIFIGCGFFVLYFTEISIESILDVEFYFNIGQSPFT